MNEEAQRIERELRDKLADSISKAVSDADRAKIVELEKAEANLRIEVLKYVQRCPVVRFIVYNGTLISLLLKLHMQSLIIL